MIMGILLSLIQQFSGCNAVLFYSNKIFKGDGATIDPFDETMAKVFTILIGFILCFGSGLAGRIIDSFGRKSMLLIGELLGTFLIFLGCCVAGLIYMALCVQETKGKTADEIEEMFEEEESDNAKESLISTDTTVTI